MLFTEWICIYVRSASQADVMRPRMCFISKLILGKVKNIT